MAQPQDARLPIDPTTGLSLPPRPQPGYYVGFRTLDQQDFWDEATRQVVLRRVQQVPPIRFFSPDEATLLQAVCDRLIPQDDRDTEHRIPIVPIIDERLHSGRIDGYRFSDTVPDPLAHRLGLQGIDRIAHHLHGAAFIDLSFDKQEEVLQTLHDGKPPSGHAIWRILPVRRYWALLLQDAIEAYYAHPYAWDEIGFGGPAYPRGYMRLENGQPEPWEVAEQRYIWAPPPTALSGYQAQQQAGSTHGDLPAGQEGTH